MVREVKIWKSKPKYCLFGEHQYKTFPSMIV